MEYPTEGAQVYAETGKSVYQTVLEEADAPDWVGHYAGYILNTSPGYRPSDAAREAVRQWKAGMTEARYNEITVKMHEDLAAERKRWGWLY